MRIRPRGPLQGQSPTELSVLGDLRKAVLGDSKPSRGFLVGYAKGKNEIMWTLFLNGKAFIQDYGQRWGSRLLQ